MKEHISTCKNVNMYVSIRELKKKDRNMNIEKNFLLWAFPLFFFFFNFRVHQEIVSITVLTVLGYG